MATCYRIVKKKYVDSAFNGKGAKEYGGRWNSKGNAVVYLTDSAPLAILEVLVHVNNTAALSDWSIFKVNIPAEKTLYLEDKDLPEDWMTSPTPQSTASIGDFWIESGDSLALSVPSSVSPHGGRVIMINLEHEDAKNFFDKASPSALDIDKRLLT